MEGPVICRKNIRVIKMGTTVHVCLSLSEACNMVITTVQLLSIAVIIISLSWSIAGITKKNRDLFIGITKYSLNYVCILLYVISFCSPLTNQKTSSFECTQNKSFPFPQTLSFLQWASLTPFSSYRPPQQYCRFILLFSFR